MMKEQSRQKGESALFRSAYVDSFDLEKHSRIVTGKQ
jgi:hypothetical protein